MGVPTYSLTCASSFQPSAQDSSASQPIQPVNSSTLLIAHQKYTRYQVPGTMKYLVFVYGCLYVMMAWWKPFLAARSTTTTAVRRTIQR